MLRKSLLVITVLFLALTAILMINTARFGSMQTTSVKAEMPPPIPAKSLQHFQQLIRFKTVSNADTTLFDPAPFLQLHEYLRNSYPLFHKNMEREVIANYTLLYHWKGTNMLPPILFIAHMDVVPVEAVNLSSWKTDPFGGAVKDSAIWGRGAWDNKVNMVSVLEATEKLLQEQKMPDRPVYFLFTHDEELAGKKGTRAAAELFRQRGIYPELIIDEGGFVTHEKVPGMNRPVALLGTAEKGYLSLQLEVQKDGGHSSMPEKETAIDVLSGALVKLREHPFKSRLVPAQRDFIRYIGPELPFLKKLVFANTWLFEKLIIREYEKTSTGSAVMHTTMVPTILRAGIKDNIVPSSATALVNLRLLPGDSCRQVTEKVTEIISDARVKVSVVEQFEPSALTPVNSLAFQKVETAVRKTFPNTIITPFLVVGATDSHHFQQIAKHIIRFTPAIDPQNFHGINERVSLRSFQMAMWFYEQLLCGV